MKAWVHACRRRTWHQLILFRAPVVVMHVAATTIVVIGWYRWRETGRGFILLFSGGHGPSRGMERFVCWIHLLIDGRGSRAPTLQGAEAIAMARWFLLLGALFIAAVVWFVSVPPGRRVVVKPPSVASEPGLIEFQIPLTAIPSPVIAT